MNGFCYKCGKPMSELKGFKAQRCDDCKQTYLLTQELFNQVKSSGKKELNNYLIPKLEQILKELEAIK
jgi:hypothetical protein